MIFPLGQASFLLLRFFSGCVVYPQLYFCRDIGYGRAAGIWIRGEKSLRLPFSMRRTEFWDEEESLLARMHPADPAPTTMWV